MTSASAKAELKSAVDEIEDGVVRFYRATADLFHEGFLRVKGEVFDAISHHPDTVRVGGDVEAAARARQEAAQDAQAKVNAAQAAGVDPSGDRVIASATGGIAPGPAREDGDDLV